MNAPHDLLSDLRVGDILTLIAVRRCGSISSAARELGVTPSQVSKAIARLEVQLQATFLSRGPRGATLSEVGARMLPQLEEFVTRLRSLQHHGPDPGPELNVAAPSFLLAAVLPRIVASQPGVRVRGLELAPALVRAYAVEGLFEVALTLGKERLPESWVSEPVGPMRKSLFASPSVARTLGPQPVSAEALREIPFVSPIYSSNGRFVATDDSCPLRYGERKQGHEVQTIGLGLELAAMTGQLVFGPVVAAHHHVQAGTLVEVKVRGWDVSDPLFLACDSDKVMARSQRAMLAGLRTALEELDAA